MKKRAFVFPGQGSQAVGMGRDIAEAFVVAREVFEEVDDALGHHLSRIIWEGPEDTLTLTENAQPALMTVSMAVMRVLEVEGGLDLSQAAVFVAGHSLGEYSALAAAGSFNLADTARLLRTRGRSMQQAVPVGAGLMAALLGSDFEEVADIASKAAQGEVCTPANDNAPGQVVISGDKAAVERAVELAKERGVRRAVLLPVSAPFHCSLMASAATVMKEALGGVTMQAPVVPLVANVSAVAEGNIDMIKEMLVEQVTGMVRWRESIEYMVDQEIEEMVEIGIGKVLSGLGKRIARDLAAQSIETSQDIEEFLDG
ncbi:MAG: ACP S-malonyltransferase [Parvularculales bacterium]